MRQITRLIIALLLCVPAAAGAQSTLSRQQYEADFDHLWQSISNRYAYFDRRETDWNRVREIYRPRLGGVETRADFIRLLEEVLEELYDFHTHLNTNTPSSPRLVPSGADVWAEWRGGHALITEVRPGSGADEAGLRAGMRVVAFNGVAIEEAARRRVGRSLRKIDQGARDWALRALLAGRRGEQRCVDVLDGGTRRAVLVNEKPSSPPSAANSLLDFRRVEGNVGYIRVNNSLGNTDLIGRFDDALDSLRDTQGLILDLRDTPSGGNTTVARAIMGRFVGRELPYQKHVIPAEERLYGTRRSWLELVSPRGRFTYSAPVVVLVNHWTGSMGEGLAIGMDGMRRAAVVGTRMAGLIGATSQVTLPNTGVGVSFPTEKLFHVNGTPREYFVPGVYVNPSGRRSSPAGDAVFEAGLRVLRRANFSRGRKARRIRRAPRRLLTH